MTKKRLTDLLQEEVNKNPESEETATDSTTEESNSSASTPVKSSRSRKTVKELTAELEAANERANFFQEQVSVLESELATQKTLVEQLQTQLQQTDQLRISLQEQTSLVSRLYEELQKAQATHSQVEEKLATEPEQAQQELLLQEELEESQSPTLIVKNTTANALSLGRRGRFVAANQSSTQLSNEDIGWFD